MEQNKQDIDSLLSEIESLKSQLFEANTIIEAIKEGSVDALVVHTDGGPEIYSLESADFTYRVLIEKFSEGALSITKDGLILYCNDYFAQLIKVPVTKITGSYLNMYLDKSELAKYISTALGSGSSKGEAMLTIEGITLPVYISFTDLHPNADAIGVIVTDLSEKKRHERSLIQYQRQLEIKVDELNITNKSLEQFIHVISHDLKEPLRKILMYSSRLDPALTAGPSNPINIIKQSAVRLDSLVDDIVKYAFSSVREDDVTEINLEDVLKDVTDDLELTIAESATKIQIDPLPPIVATRVQMRQLFSNLISNAIKYSRKDVPPEIKISHEFAEDHDERYGKKFYKISVSDNGIGMDIAHLDKIFTIFQRLHNRNEYSGNGIGLAICKKIMENHSGRIQVESTLDHGSTFNLYFPVPAP